MPWPWTSARQEDVDAGVSVIGVVLLGVLDAPDDDAVQFDGEDRVVRVVLEPGLGDALRRHGPTSGPRTAPEDRPKAFDVVVVAGRRTTRSPRRIGSVMAGHRTEPRGRDGRGLVPSRDATPTRAPEHLERPGPGRSRAVPGCRDAPGDRRRRVGRGLARALVDEHAIVIADGAMGTMLFSAGLQFGDPPEAWNVSRARARPPDPPRLPRGRLADRHDQHVRRAIACAWRCTASTSASRS